MNNIYIVKREIYKFSIIVICFIILDIYIIVNLFTL